MSWHPRGGEALAHELRHGCHGRVPCAAPSCVSPPRDAVLRWLRSFEVSDQPVRAGKFVPRKQWIVAGSDDMQIRVYNYNTMEKVKVFEAHSDYIRCLAVHGSQVPAHTIRALPRASDALGDEEARTSA